MYISYLRIPQNSMLIATWATKKQTKPRNNGMNKILRRSLSETMRSRIVYKSTPLDQMARTTSVASQKVPQLSISREQYFPTKLSRILDTDRTVKVTAKGKLPTLRALVVSGNGNGAAGFGKGKGKSMKTAISDAVRKSEKKWVTVNLQDNALARDVTGSFKGTKVLLRAPKKSNKLVYTVQEVEEDATDLVCSRLIHGICECFGIKKVNAKILTRKRSPYAVCKAVFNALSKHDDPKLARVR
eukprot:maker-scaffold_11-snap-gene-11.30-mRNA-1 protein AED:0.00 eAED:0.00 QI:285/1/1/1/1/1/2/112/242